MTTLTLAEIQPFIDFVNGNLGLKPYTLQSLTTWSASAGKPLVASGVGYGVVLGEFPATGVTTVNGRSGDVVLDNTDVGLGNVPNVNCTDASNITTGMLPLSVIPAAALERLVHVSDEPARFLLTTAEVQNGDIVQQDDTGIMYKVVDDANLDNAAGYNEFTAGIAAAVNWSGILGMPAIIQDLVVVGGGEEENDMLVFRTGHWMNLSPNNVRINLDLPVKGSWDMSPVAVDNSVLFSEYPPMGFDPTEIEGTPFPTILLSGALHRMTVQEGALPSPGYIAISENMASTLLLPAWDTADIPFPTAPGAQTPFLLSFGSTVSQGLLQELDINDVPINFPSAGFVSQIYGKDVATTDYFSVMVMLQHTYVSVSSPTGCTLHISASGRTAGSNYSSGANAITQAVPLPFEDLRVVLYFDADSRQVGVMIDGVDQGWLLSGGGVPITVSPAVNTLGALKQGAYEDVSATDVASIGQSISLTHSITLTDIVETSPLNPFVEWGTYDVIYVDPIPPAGVEMCNRYTADPGGSYNGVVAETGDIVEFLSDTPPYNIFVYPKADSLVRLPMLADYATLVDLGNLQNDVVALGDSLTTIDGRVTSLENSFSTIDNRTARERFLTGTGRIVGASSNGSDLHAGFANGGDAVIVTSFTDTYVGVTGQFLGFPVGSLAVREADSWVNFTPQPGDEYTFISKVYASDYPNTGQLIPLVFKMTYVGGSPGTGLPGVDSGGTFISPQFASGYQDRTPLAWEAGYAQYGGAFHQLGWLMHPQANGPRGEKVKYILSTSGLPVEVNPLSDDVVYIRNSTSESVIDLHVVMPKPTDQIGDADRTYAWILAGAAQKTRVIIDCGITPSTFSVYVRQYATLGEVGGGGRNVPVAHFLYRSVQAANPGDNIPGSLVYDSRGMVLDVWIDPSSDGTGYPQPTVRVERKDRGGKVAYEPYPATLYTDNIAAPDLRVVHWEALPTGQYVPALGRSIAWMVLPPPTQEGVRLLVRVGGNYRDPEGPQHSIVWTTTPNETGLPVGLKAGTDTHMPTSVHAGQVMEFVCVREVLTTWPEVSLGTALVWSWVPPVAQNFRVAKFEEAFTTYLSWNSYGWAPDTYSTYREASFVGSGSFAGFPFIVWMDTVSLKSHKEGEVIAIRIKSDEDSGKSIGGLHFRNQSANTVNLPGTIDRDIWAPFDIVTSFVVVDGVPELLHQSILEEKVGDTLVTPISAISVSASFNILLSRAGVGSGGWPLSTRLPAVGEYSVATHKVTVQAHSGNSRSYFKEILVRVKCDGSTTTKVAETVVYEDKDNVTTELSVSVDVNSAFVGDGTTLLAVVGVSTVSETIHWSGKIESFYGN